MSITFTMPSELTALFNINSAQVVPLDADLVKSLLEFFFICPITNNHKSKMKIKFKNRKKKETIVLTILWHNSITIL